MPAPSCSAASRWSCKTPLDAQKHGIVTIYQEFNLIPTMTVAENMFLGREPGSGRVRLLVADARRDREGARDGSTSTSTR